MVKKIEFFYNYKYKNINNIDQTHSFVKMSNLDYKLCKLEIILLKDKIPYKIYIQKSKVIRYENKTFYPKIFLTKFDYYKMIKKTLYNIIYLLNSSKLKFIKKNNLQKKMIICITHSGFIIFKFK